MDCEVLQMIQRYGTCDYWYGPDDTAVEAIKDVGSDGHFFGIQHARSL